MMQRLPVLLLGLLHVTLAAAKPAALSKFDANDLAAVAGLCGGTFSWCSEEMGVRGRARGGALPAQPGRQAGRRPRREHGGDAAAEADVWAAPGEIDRVIPLSAVPVAEPEHLQGSVLFHRERGGSDGRPDQGTVSVRAGAEAARPPA